MEMKFKGGFEKASMGFAALSKKFLTFLKKVGIPCSVRGQGSWFFSSGGKEFLCLLSSNLLIMLKKGGDRSVFGENGCFLAITLFQNLFL